MQEENSSQKPFCNIVKQIITVQKKLFYKFAVCKKVYQFFLLNVTLTNWYIIDVSEPSFVIE